MAWETALCSTRFLQSLLTADLSTRFRLGYFSPLAESKPTTLRCSVRDSLDHSSPLHFLSLNAPIAFCADCLKVSSRALASDSSSL